ncbi:Aste57867_12288 [Aphanomyces stellatus]|uniref:Regulator of microtubule dynamics protein 1 n=1 Tax=Aphanomyces stellatus TaxID=120398 RepID=A0A485KVK9_9STRA|nr:hypothetical protein As57867_012243 [Aphanomyces stellatus]VFT89141.1 Aste57867_12288 [Aphanomyces stellatus]
MNVVQQVDALYKDPGFSRRKILAMLRDANQATPNDPDILWRYAQALFTVGKMSSANTQAETANEALEIARQAALLAPENPTTHKWVGIILYDMDHFDDLRSKLMHAQSMLVHLKRACDLGGDAECFHLLGLVSLSIASLPWRKRVAAKALVPNAILPTFDDALASFEAFEAHEPKSNRLNVFCIAQVLAKLKRPAEAKAWLEICNAMVRTRGDKEKKLDSLVLALAKSLSLPLRPCPHPLSPRKKEPVVNNVAAVELV